MEVLKSVIDQGKNIISSHGSGVLVFCISLLVFVSIMVLGIQTDIQTHIIRNSYPNPSPGLMPNFLFYWAVWLLSFVLRSKMLMGGVVAIILALAVLWKFFLSSRIISTDLNDSEKAPLESWVRFSSVALIFLFSLPVDLNIQHYYLGQFPANIWHNSTTIVVMPFVILAFDSCCQYFTNSDNKSLRRLFLWSILIYIIKPSILPILVIVFPVFTLVQYGFKRPFVLSLIYGAFFGALLLLPMLWMQSGGTGRNEGGGLEFALFKVWSLYSNNYWASILASLLFPVVCLILYLKMVIRDVSLMFSWAIWILSFLLFAFVNETGSSLKAGNFGWQVIMATYLLFLTNLVFFNRIRAGREKVFWKERVVVSIFGLHLISGMVYLFKMMILGYG